MVARLLARRRARLERERALAQYVRSAIRDAMPPAVLPWHPGLHRTLRLHALEQIPLLDQPHRRTHRRPLTRTLPEPQA